MIDPQILAGGYQSNGYVIDKLTEGLTHADSLQAPPFGGNCINWVLGHILANRERALKLLDQPPYWPEERAARYQSGSEPVTGEADVYPLEALLADVLATGDRIAAALAARTADDLAASLGEDTLGGALFGLCWHETYHAGQIELLRRLAGKEEAVF